MATLEPLREGELSTYDVARAAGVERIQQDWRFLAGRTKRSLLRSHFYSASGHRFDDKDVLKKVREAESEGRGVNEPDVNQLEHALGVLQRCVSAKIPTRDEAYKGASVPWEARLYVTEECNELLHMPDWQDPQFLRLALSAIVVNGLANALTMTGLGPTPSAPTGLGIALQGFYMLGMLIICPFAAAYVLVAASDHNLIGASIAMYVVTIGISMALSVRHWDSRKHTANDIANSSSPFSMDNRTTQAEHEHVAWSRLHHFLRAQGGTAIGAGARFFLEQMSADGVRVPGVAIDICAALEFQTLRGT